MSNNNKSFLKRIFSKKENTTTIPDDKVLNDVIPTEDMIIPSPVAGEVTSSEPEVEYTGPVEYNRYSLYRNVNVMPQIEFKQLVRDTFQTLTETLRLTYGPYGSHIMITEGLDRISTKDGYHVFRAMDFTNSYKKEVYTNILEICDRVNHMVGDGTTSCILLAEKMFKIVDAVIQTPNDKRNAKKILDKIEHSLQEIETIKSDMEKGIIKPITATTMKNMLSMADNYDEDLSQVLYDTFDPVVSESGDITHVSTIIPEEIPDRDSRTDVQFTVTELPGKYRIRVHNPIDQTMTDQCSVWTNAKLALYDHTFTLSDWTELMLNRDTLDNTRIIILGRGLSHDVKNEAFPNYIRKRNALGAKTCPLNFFIVRGNATEEIADLAALLNVEPYKIVADRPIKVEEMPDIRFKIHIGNCMCFDNVEPPVGYIEKLRTQMNIESVNSYERKREIMDRINALSMAKTDDKVLTLRGTNPLELRLISDKIDDCRSIVESAINYGTVPNMLKYGYYRLSNIDIDKDINIDHDVSVKILDAMKQAIKGLFIDIWRSKYGADKDMEGNEICNKFYDEENSMVSYNIIKEEIVDFTNFPTSAQYDLEVIVASLSIVKFLLTSNAFIFDARLLATQQQMQFDQYATY